MKGSCLINIQSIDLHIIKRFLLFTTSNFNMKYLDIICYFKKTGKHFLDFYVSLTSEYKVLQQLEEMTLKHRYVSFKVVFLHRKTRQKFLSLSIAEKIK